MKPCNKKCFIRPEIEGRKTDGGLHLPDHQWRHLPNVGTVTHLPEGDFDFKVGDRVFYNDKKSDMEALNPKYFGSHKMAVVPVDEVMAVLEPA